MKRKPSLFPPGWLENTSNDPKLAAHEIERSGLELERVLTENVRVRRERDQLRREKERSDEAVQRANAELESERRAVRSSQAARVEAERLLEKYRQLSDKEAKKARDVECVLNKEKDHTATLERRVRKLEQAVFKARAQRNAGSLVSAIAKLAASPAVGRRLAAACHPDKVPAEYSDLADQLFKFVQNVRDSSSS